MAILAFDTAMGACSVAMAEGRRVLASRFEVMPRGQSEALMPMIEAVTAESGVPLRAITRIGVTRGPGAFTGVRIGLAAARALALALGVPCVGVSTLAVLEHAARAAGVEGPVAALIDSKRGDLFTERFDAPGVSSAGPARRAVEDVVSDLENRPAACLVGDGAALVLAEEGIRLNNCFVHEDLAQPRAGNLAVLAASARCEDAKPEPLYLRPADAAPPRHGGRLRP